MSLFMQATILFLLGIVTRIPFQSEILHDMDSYNFAKALDRFDVRLHQPHTPGTFFLYVLMGRLFRIFFHDHNTSLVGLNIFASGLAAALIFILGATWFGQQTGWVIALIMLTGPLIWFQGEVALSYMPEFALVLLIILLCNQVRLGNRIVLFVSASLIGLSGGFRPNTPFFLFPLWLLAVFMGWRTGKYLIRHLAIAILLVLIGVCLWAVPMITLSGGVSGYWEAMQPWFAKHPKDGSTWAGKYRNIKLVVESGVYGVGFSFLPMVWAVRHYWKELKMSLSQDWRAQSLLVWIIPGFLYLSFIHIQQRGHTFTIMPAFIVIAGFSTVLAGQHLQKFRRHALVILILLVTVGNSLFFVFGPARLDGIPTWTTIWKYDNHVTERLQFIRQQFPQPKETMILTRERNIAMRSYYLPEYETIPKLTSEVITLPPIIKTLVLFDANVLPEYQAEAGFQIVSLPTTGEIRYITWQDKQQVKLSKFSFVINNL